MPESVQITNYEQLVEVAESLGGPSGRLREVLVAGRGFSLPFENGWTVSVIWQKDFSLDADQTFESEPESADLTVTTRDGRVVVWSDAGEALGKSLDHPGRRPGVPAVEILRVIDEVATWPTDHLPIMDRTTLS